MHFHNFCTSVLLCNKFVFLKTCVTPIFFAHVEYLRTLFSPSHSLQICKTGKLKKWDTVDEVHRTIEIPEAPKVGDGSSGSGKPRVNKTGIPLPPPPPAHLLKPLHVETSHDKNASKNGGSPVSSFYSPGNVDFKPRYVPPGRHNIDYNLQNI